MSTVAEIALAVQDMVNDDKYSMVDLELEMVMLDMSMDGVTSVVDSEKKLAVFREMAGNDWLRVVTLLVYWHLDSLMSGGYFKDA